MQATKFRAKLGNFEIDYEGDEGFLRTEVASLLSKISETLKDLPASVVVTAPASPPSGPGVPANADGRFDQSTNTIASLISAKTGTDLAIAAAAHLALVQGRDKFQRKDLLDEMQAATTYYNQNYSGNLSKILTSLVKGKRLNLVGTHTYALTKSERDAMETRLAQSG